MKWIQSIAIIVFSAVVFAQTAPDNTKVNERDRMPNEVTADQQKGSAADTDVTRRIREELMKDNGLSTYAQNIKIISMKGKVTLKGPVRSRAELDSIMKYALSVAGAGNVINQMEVAPKKK